MTKFFLFYMRFAYNTNVQKLGGVGTGQGFFLWWSGLFECHFLFFYKNEEGKGKLLALSSFFFLS